MADELQINSLKRQIGQLTFRVAITQLRQAQSEFTSVEGGMSRVQNALRKVGISQTFTPLDVYYYFTSFDNWQKIIDVLNPIAQNFQWESERFDCDNRANLITSLVSLMFRINTCGTLYCQVFDSTTGELKYHHYCNIIIDSADNVYLWDVDYGGKIQKITSSNIVIGVNKYVPLAVRSY